MSTETINKVAYIQLGRVQHILYLVLKKKPFTQQIIEEIQEEMEKRFSQYLQNIIHKLINMKFDNPNQALKVLFLKILINVANQMVNEDKIHLSNSDLKLLEEIYKEEDKNDNMKKEENDDSKKESPTSSFNGLITKKNEDQNNTVINNITINNCHFSSLNVK